jgi:hypothetical protein
MRFPKTLLEFQAQFPDEESCWDYLRRVRWPRGFVCPRCRARYSHFIETRRLEQCAECRYQASVTAGTVLHGTRVSLRVWFLGAFFLGRHKKGISALQFQRDTGLGNYQTAWSLLHKLRSGLARNPAARLTGAVEADETYLGGYHPGRGRGLGKTGVAVAVERRARGAGKARLGVVRRATSEELCALPDTRRSSPTGGPPTVSSAEKEFPTIPRSRAGGPPPQESWLGPIRSSGTSRAGSTEPSTESAASTPSSTSMSSSTASIADGGRPNSSALSYAALHPPSLSRFTD